MKLDLDEIKAALATVLPGPWRYDVEARTVWASKSVRPIRDSNPLGRVCDATGRWAMHDPTHEDMINANLQFIAKCRDWIPALVAEVERLRQNEEATGMEP